MVFLAPAFFVIFYQENVVCMVKRTRSCCNNGMEPLYVNYTRPCVIAQGHHSPLFWSPDNRFSIIARSNVRKRGKHLKKLLITFVPKPELFVGLFVMFYYYSEIEFTSIISKVFLYKHKSSFCVGVSSIKKQLALIKIFQVLYESI